MAGPAVSFTFVRRRSSLPHIVRHDQFLVPGYAFMLGASPRLICSRVTPGLPYSLGGGPELLAGGRCRNARRPGGRTAQDIRELGLNRRDGAILPATVSTNGSRGVCKPRFSLADYNDIPHDQRAMDRDITIHQIVRQQDLDPLPRCRSFRACLL
jgi:hypothetical protein